MESGVLFDANTPNNQGLNELQIPWWKKSIYSVMRFIGASITSFSMAALIFVYGPIGYQQFQALTARPVYAKEIAKSPIQQKQAKVTTNRFQVDKKEAMESILSGEFSINIPQIGAKANIIPNVDPYSEEEYKVALKEGIAHAKGTGFPGGGETIYLFAHSTDSPANIARYNAVFYRLIELKKGSPVSLFFNNTQHDYEVESTHIVSPKDVDWLKVYNKEELVMQTCYPPGTTQKRLIVVARKIS